MAETIAFMTGNSYNVQHVFDIEYNLGARHYSSQGRGEIIFRKLSVYVELLDLRETERRKLVMNLESNVSEFKYDGGVHGEEAVELFT